MFIIFGSIFQVSLKFFLCRDLVSKNTHSQLKTTLPLMTPESMAERAWAEDIGQFLYHLDPDKGKITRRLEKIKLKMVNSAPSSLKTLAWINV